MLIKRYWKKRLNNEWDTLYEHAEAVPAAQVLRDNVHLLPHAGNALDLACGLAENAFLLAARGFQVTAWDNSVVAVRKVNKKAVKTGLAVSATLTDILSEKIPENTYDVIVFTHFLEQSLSKNVVDALKPGGLLFYQTFTREKVTACGPEEKKYQLTPNEPLFMFSGLKTVVYREEGRLGNLSRGFRNEAMLIAQKNTL